MSNITSNSTGYESEHVNMFHIFEYTLKSILVIFIVFGNILTITAIYRFKYLRIPSYIMIGTLSISDLCVGTITSPLLMMRVYNPILFENRIVCTSFIFTTHCISIFSITFQATLCIERFFAVQFPFQYHAYVTVRYNVILSAVLFLLIVAVNFPVLCGIDNWSETNKCYAPGVLPTSYVRFTVLLASSFMFIGLLAFFRVLAAELNYRRKDKRERTDLERRSSAQSTVMILAYAVSIILYLPHVIFYIWGAVTQTPPDPVILGVMEILDLLNSAVNCVVYGLKNRNFRDSYKRLLGIKTARVESNPTLTTNT